MVKEAEMNAEADRRQQDMIEIRNRGESLAHQTERVLKESEDKIDEATRQRATEKIQALRTAIQGDDPDEIQRLYSELEAESHAISEQLYKASAGDAPEGEPQATSAAPDEEVIEAEFKEEK